MKSKLLLIFIFFTILNQFINSQVSSELEFIKLNKLFGIADSNGKKFDSYLDYSNYRNTYFQNISFEKYVYDCSVELDKYKIRESFGGYVIPEHKFIEFKSNNDKFKTELDILYAWTKRMYEKNNYEALKVYENYGLPGTKKIREIFKQGIFELKGIDIRKYKDSISGFTPRPKKRNTGNGLRFCLGSFSNHAIGTALDIRVNSNKVISIPAWDLIQKIAGINVDRNKSRWKMGKNFTDSMLSKSLFEEILTVHNNFFKNTRETIRKLKIEGLKIEEIYRRIFGENIECMNYYKGGVFFDLDWIVVNYLREQGLVWGVVFEKQIDLHHFEFEYNKNRQ